MKKNKDYIQTLDIIPKEILTLGLNFFMTQYLMKKKMHLFFFCIKSQRKYLTIDESISNIVYTDNATPNSSDKQILLTGHYWSKANAIIEIASVQFSVQFDPFSPKEYVWEEIAYSIAG